MLPTRIHQIGQQREVTTVRFYIRDSYENNIMETQESKKNLANVLLSGYDGRQADDSLDALQVRSNDRSLFHESILILLKRLRSLL